ncbi:MAG: hypothetical protein DRQ02_02680 [Candidatus Latescibacterota bacterium]|nr:MAG: hypothetical protein DRQ02_02680 [Candidatus Latescibacterota bacterium]
MDEQQALEKIEELETEIAAIYSWLMNYRLTTRRLEVLPTGQVGEVLHSIDGQSSSSQIPLTDLAGWLVEEVNGVMLVVDER